MTFFDWVRAEGQAEVSRRLGELEYHAVRVHRAFRAKHAPDEELIARCEVVLGDRFNRPGTLDEWYRLRRAQRDGAGLGVEHLTSSTPADTSRLSDGGLADAHMQAGEGGHHVA